LTTLRLVAGIGAALAFASGDQVVLYWGCGLFVFSMLLDRADGILARLGGRTSRWGHRYDLIADSLSNALAFFGIGIGLRGGDLGLWAVPMGLAAGISVTAILWLVMRAEEREGQRAAEISGKGGFDPDDAMLFVPAAMALGWGHGLLIAASVAAPCFAIFFFWKFRRHL
jgi:phosphatidylglycerophosphate synthase